MRDLRRLEDAMFGTLLIVRQIRQQKEGVVVQKMTRIVGGLDANP